MLAKKCGKCEEVLPASSFSKNSTKSSKLQSWCRSCCKNHSKSNKSNYVYIIKRHNEDLYVGSCVDIKQRTSAHIHGHVPTTRDYMLQNEWTSIIYVDVSEYVDSRLEREFLEYALIELICPSLNILDRDITLNNDSKEEYLMEVANDLVDLDLFKIYKENRKDLQ